MTDKTYDGAEMLSKLTGIPKSEVHSIWEDVKANHAKLRACVRHRFDGGFQIGKRKTCLECGGTMTLTDIGEYIRGFKAASGDVNAIWPDYEKTKS